MFVKLLHTHPLSSFLFYFSHMYINTHAYSSAHANTYKHNFFVGCKDMHKLTNRTDEDAQTDAGWIVFLFNVVFLGE